MRLNKEEFLKTELGGEIDSCIRAWDEALDNQIVYPYGTIPHEDAEKLAYWCQAQWEAYKIAIKQFYGIEYWFTRTDEYFGLINSEDEEDWLIKVEREV